MHEHIEKALYDLRDEFETKSMSTLAQYLRARIIDWQRRHPGVGVTLWWYDDCIVSIYPDDEEDLGDELHDLQNWVNEFLDDYFSEDVSAFPNDETQCYPSQ